MGPLNRYAYIDSLRAVAALLVVWQHAAEQFMALSANVTNAWVFGLAQSVNFGRLGVVIFFCISGYVIPSSFAADDTAAGRRFLIRRFFRLYPAFWLSIPAGVLTIWALHGEPLSLKDLLLNFTMVPELLGAKPAIGLYWTLAYELAFYGLCLGLWRAGVLSSTWTFPLLLAVAVLAAGLLFAITIWGRTARAGEYAATALNYAAMFLGVCWRRWRAMGKSGWAAQGLAAAAAAGCILVLPAVCAYLGLVKGAHNAFFTWFPAAYGGGMALFLICTSVARISWRPLAWAGLISYSLYLFHPVVMFPFRQAVAALLHGRAFDLGVMVAITAAAAGVLATLVYYGLEAPAIALGRRISARACDRP